MWTRHPPDGYDPHPLHRGERIWPETNCYVDLWIEALHARGLEPRAMLGFTVTQDFEGDQFTFFKVPLEDLETLYGLRVQELAIYDGVEAHVAEQLRRSAHGGLVLVEVDGFHLPDTRGTSYGTTHVKTTVGIVRIDPAARVMEYFHNAGFHRLEGADYEGVMAAAAGPLFPYVEFVKPGRPALEGGALVTASLDLLRRHLARRPAGNPMAAYRAAFPEHLERLLARWSVGDPMAYFHLYAFNLLRQFGANFELLGAHLRWLDGPADAVEGCRSIAEAAKAMQFQLARTVARRKLPDLTDGFDRLERDYDTVLGGLARRYG
ncbi:hypothetical protein AZL_e01480 (plasmid) [Azospirillum sp. B510]|uniref:DUF1839 family protein n=1 Tax=Azospirillum sp. (strain B510) TaxID=137722 RepID=UPI0001C4CDE7|nr:DUF1839 family protein [Azospirillum sp. B510]BAI76493.1 hypothetical protein AZL_e01480 [Azospirillum sp. B510]